MKCAKAGFLILYQVAIRILSYEKEALYASQPTTEPVS